MINGNRAREAAGVFVVVIVVYLFVFSQVFDLVNVFSLECFGLYRRLVSAQIHYS